MKLRTITLRIIPHANHRSATTGDYYQTSPGHWVIAVSKMKDWRHSALVALHELVELITTQAAGVPEPTIAAFDAHCSDDEPGDNPLAPYHRQHLLATNIERILANEFKLDWKAYNRALSDLWKPKKKPAKKHRPAATSARKK